MTYLISKIETDTPATALTVTTAAQTLASFVTNEDSSELKEVTAIVRVISTATSANTNNVIIRITIGGVAKDFIIRVPAAIQQQLHTVQASSVSKLKDTITIAVLGAAADAQTSATVAYASLRGITT